MSGGFKLKFYAVSATIQGRFLGCLTTIYIQTHSTTDLLWMLAGAAFVAWSLCDFFREAS